MGRLCRSAIMDLNYSEDHQAFRVEVQRFLRESVDLYPKPFGINRPTPEALAWQRLLIEKGYAARTIPVEYGGYGAEPDALKSRIIAEEFARMKAPMGLTSQGISMLVPTLLELGTEEQKRRWISPTLRGEVIWCQGYSEPEAGADLASLKTFAVEDGDDLQAGARHEGRPEGLRGAREFDLGVDETGEHGRGRHHRHAGLSRPRNEAAGRGAGDAVPRHGPADRRCQAGRPGPGAAHRQ